MKIGVDSTTSPSFRWWDFGCLVKKSYFSSESIGASLRSMSWFQLSLPVLCFHLMQYFINRLVMLTTKQLPIAIGSLTALPAPVLQPCLRCLKNKNKIATQGDKVSLNSGTFETIFRKLPTKFHINFKAVYCTR
jgi:hypothetical protein